ncbi:unnamed protein product [Protopolystoma xenopodis]|uniref:Uncharacterized protein n=1 Tax=Protopolystoma xenopodis TaxID=117903 RepID=A0A3S5A635_9PLAT|nr:unnamed protein product [Protopolystoma xenopodis]
MGTRRRVVMIAFVGGVTHAEISAIRTLAILEAGNLEFIIATTGILTYRDVWNSFSEPISPSKIIPF